MNGELLHMAEQVVFAKNYLKTGDMPDSALGYVNSLNFVFCASPHERLRKNIVVEDATKRWTKRLQKLGLCEIVLRINERVSDINSIAFSNGFRDCAIETTFQSGATAWTKQWALSQGRNVWDVVYLEQSLERVGFPVSEDPTAAFRSVLLEIGRLAKTLGFEWFAERFQKAEEILMERALSECPYAELPPKSRRLFSAAQCAYVFGGMGWWNDSPPYAAAEKGLEEDYNLLTGQLFQEIMRALMYAVNSW